LKFFLCSRGSFPLNTATAKGSMGYYISSKRLKLLIHVYLYIFILGDYTPVFPLVGLHAAILPIITSQVQKQKAWKLFIFSSLWEFKKKGHGMAEYIKPFLFSRMTLKIKLIKLSSKKKKKKKKNNTLSLSMEKPLLRIVLCLAQSSALSRTNPYWVSHTGLDVET